MKKLQSAQLNQTGDTWRGI